jgi:hypothetical protein
MTFEEFERIIFESKSNDWIFNDSEGAYIYKKDLNVRIQRKEEDELDERKFKEKWTEKFPDRNAYRQEYALFYGSSYCGYQLLIAVDGFRAYIPIPKSSGELKITKKQYSFGKIINDLNRDELDQYLKMGGISVEE